MGESVLDIARRAEKMLIQVSNSGMKVRVIENVLGDNLLDQYFLPNAYMITQIFENARLKLWRTEDFFEPQIAGYEFGKDNLYRTQQLHVQPALYELVENTPLNAMFKIPFYVDNTLTYLGRTSFIITSSLCDGISGKELATGKVLLVYVDQKSVTPVPLPPRVKEKYLPLIKNQPITFEKVPSPGVRVLTWPVTPTQSDHDSNLHVNNAFYPRYFQDCAFYASDQNFYRQLAPPISKHRVLYFLVNYISPSDSSMLLLCQTWEADQEDKTVYFRLINSKDGALIATAILKCGSEVSARYFEHPLLAKL